MNKSLRIVAAVLALVVTGGLAAAQDPEPSNEAQLVETLDVRLLEYSVFARYSDGSPVVDLTPEKLFATDRGNRLRIAYVERIFEDTAASMGPNGHFAIELSKYKAESVERAEGTRAPRSFVLFIDTANDGVGNAKVAGDVVKAFLEKQLIEGDELAIFAFDGTLHLEQSFTTDRKKQLSSASKVFTEYRGRPNVARQLATSLVRGVETCAQSEIAALHNKGPGESGGIPDMPDPGLAAAGAIPIDRDCLEGNARAFGEQMANEGQRFLGALEKAAEYAGGGTKPSTLFILSHGAILEPKRPFMEALRYIHGNSAGVAQLETQLDISSEIGPMLDAFAQRAADAGVVLHFIDGAPAVSGGLSNRGRGIYRSEGKPVKVAFDMGRVSAAMLARETGGTFRAERDLAAGLEQALEADRGRYRVGVYVPHSMDADDKPRFSSNLDGVDMIAGRGSSERGEADSGSASSKAQTEAGSFQVLVNPKNITDGPKGSRAIPLMIVVHPGELGYEQDGSRLSANLTVTLRLIDAGGNECLVFNKQVRHMVPASGWEAKGKPPIGVGGKVAAPAGSYTIIGEVTNPDASNPVVQSASFDFTL